MAVGAGAAGCVDAKGSFDQFADRVGFTDASTVDRAGGDIHDITGTFLYVTKAGFETSNDPAFYIQFILRSTVTFEGDTAIFNGEVTPLCTYTTCTERSEVPPALVSSEATINADGTFETGFSGTLPALGNPFSGTPQPLTVVASGTIMSADFFCGEVSGSAAGLDLQGSTFAATRITDTTPANLPMTPPNCPAGGVDAGVDAMPDAPVDAGVDAEPDATP